MTTPRPGTPAHTEIHASDHSVAAHTIDTLNLILEAPVATAATTTVLPVELLVSDNAPFIGRHAEIDCFTQVFAPHSSGTIIVAGPPGVGKTALTRHAIDLARGQFAHALVADLHGYDEDPGSSVQPDTLYPALLHAFGVPDADVPSRPADQAALYHRVLHMLAGASKPVLIWLDNVCERSQFDGLRPANPVHKLVINTRESFGHIANRHVIELDVLDPAEAVLLMTAAAEDRNPGEQRFDQEADAAAQLATLCDGLPLALQIVTALLADEPHRPICELVADLGSEASRLNTLHYDKDLSVRAALELSYTRLPEDLQSVFRLLSVVPGSDIGLQAAGWLLDAPPEAVRPKLMALVRSHLLRQHVHNRWSMHDLIRIYSAEQSATNPDESAAAFRRIIQNYSLHVAAAGEWLSSVVSDLSKRLFDSPERAANWFDAERLTAIAIVLNASARPEYVDAAAICGITLGNLLQQQRHWWTDLHDVSAAIAPLAPQVRDKRVAAATLNLYGVTFQQRGELSRALELFAEADEIEQEMGDEESLRASRSNVATTLVHQGRVDEAIELYRADISSCREAIPPNRFREARALNNLGTALLAAERYTEAVEPLRQAIAIMRLLHDLPGVAVTSSNLGIALQQVGALRKDVSLVEEAVTVLEEAVEIYRQRGNDSKQADAAKNLIPALLALGRGDDAAARLAFVFAYYNANGESARSAELVGFVKSLMDND